MLRTPNYDLHTYSEVYEPAEDSFLFLDALEKENEFLKSLNPNLAVEIGSGSGIVITALSFILQNTCAYFSTDINFEACLATKSTATLNNVDIHMVNMDLLCCFKSKFDVILFNPPYVVTNPSEIEGQGLNRAWAGGVDGREVTDRVLRNLPSLLNENGVFYLLLLRENNIDEITQVMSEMGFSSSIVLERKIPGEYLFVYKFQFKRK